MCNTATATRNVANPATTRVPGRRPRGWGSPGRGDRVGRWAGRGGHLVDPPGWRSVQLIRRRRRSGCGNLAVRCFDGTDELRFREACRPAVGGVGLHGGRRRGDGGESDHASCRERASPGTMPARVVSTAVTIAVVAAVFSVLVVLARGLSGSNDVSTTTTALAAVVVVVAYEPILRRVRPLVTRRLGGVAPCGVADGLLGAIARFEDPDRALRDVADGNPVSRRCGLGRRLARRRSCAHRRRCRSPRRPARPTEWDHRRRRSHRRGRCRRRAHCGRCSGHRRAGSSRRPGAARGATAAAGQHRRRGGDHRPDGEVAPLGASPARAGAASARRARRAAHGDRAGPAHRTAPPRAGAPRHVPAARRRRCRQARPAGDGRPGRRVHHPGAARRPRVAVGLARACGQWRIPGHADRGRADRCALRRSRGHVCPDRDRRRHGAPLSRRHRGARLRVLSGGDAQRRRPRFAVADRRPSRRARRLAVLRDRRRWRRVPERRARPTGEASPTCVHGSTSSAAGCRSCPRVGVLRCVARCRSRGWRCDHGDHRSVATARGRARRASMSAPSPSSPRSSLDACWRSASRSATPTSCRGTGLSPSVTGPSPRSSSSSLPEPSCATIPAIRSGGCSG